MSTQLINRRQFVQMIALVSTSWPLSGYAKNKTLGKKADLVYKDLSDPWLSIAAVQEHLFPADESSPGAQDISALRFMQNILDAPDVVEKQKNFIFQGVGWLNDLSVKDYKTSFIKLNTENKEKILRKIEGSSAGNRWLSVMLTYLIEALLSDPVYGGNKDQKGWKWLEHQPGFPTPTTDQVYFKMDQLAENNLRRRTKS